MNIVILGPTAVGKTKVSIEIAQRINAEIIYSDSVAIYKGMDIGSAKPSSKERSLVTHHLIDIKYPNESFSSGEFVSSVTKIIRDIKKKGKAVLISGSSGFYIDSLIFGIDKIESVDEKVKNFFDDICLEFSPYYLYKFLQVIDRKWSDKIDKNDCQRIKRGLSVYIDKNRELSNLFSRKRKQSNDFQIFVLYASKEFIDKRIEQRVDLMIENGLIDEVQNLIKQGYISSKPLQSIGYKETIMYLNNEIDKRQLSEMIKKNTKAYAKRQMTLLRSKFNKAVWIDIENENPIDAILTRLYPYKHL